MFFALHPIPSAWDVLLVLALLALVFLGIPAAVGLLIWLVMGTFIRRQRERLAEDG